MTTGELERRIGEVSRRIFSYCAVRTENHFDAEDMAQDILLALTRALPDLRSDEAFYGFMWTIAGNVCRQWYRKKYRRSECALDESCATLPDVAETCDDASDMALLRRELALLNSRMRRVTVIPVHLRKLAESMSYLMMLDIGVAVPLDILKRDGYLMRQSSAEMLPTTHVILPDQTI